MSKQKQTSLTAIGIPILVALLVASGAALAQESTWITTDGNWGTPTNWNPQSVPDSPGESALVPEYAGSCTITLDLSPTVDRIRVLDPGATLRLGSRTINTVLPDGLQNHGILRADGNPRLHGHVDNRATGRIVVESNRELSLYGSTIVNDGEIVVNEQGLWDAAIDVLADLSLSGTGMLTLNGDDANDRVYAYYGNVLTQQAGHTIHGFGSVGAPVVNHGTVDADRSGGFLRLNTYDKTNDGLMRASNGGVLHVQSINIWNAGGTILADGGDVLLEGTTVTGGTIDRTGLSVARSRNAWLTDLTIAPTGWIDIPNGYALYLNGAEIVNDGTIRLNELSTWDATIDVRSNLSLSGTGEILMNGDNDTDVLLAYYGNTLTQQADHTIRGQGRITAPLVNLGTVDADDADGRLQLTGHGKQNRGLLRASDGGVLHLLSFPLDNEGGTIMADGGDVLLEGTSMNVTGGTIGRTGASVIRSRNAVLTDVTIPAGGWIDVPSQYTLYVQGAGIVNHGTIRLNETHEWDSSLDVRSDLSLSGSGEILLNGDSQGDAIIAYYGHTLTQEAGHRIRGFGAITAPFVNHGTVDADYGNGGYLRLSGAEKRNDGLLRASNGGELQIHNCTVRNAGGTIFADGGDVDLYNQTNVVGGTLRRSGASVVKARNGWLTDAAIAADGRVEVMRDHTLYLSGTQIVNDGTIRVNQGDGWNATIDVRSALSLAGAGEILMDGDDANDVIFAFYGHALTQEVGHTIRGFGAITAPLVNHGTVDADHGNGGYLRLSGAEKRNDGLLRASNGGELQIHNCTVQNAGGTIFADGGDVDLYNQANVVGGTLRRSGASVVKARNGWLTDAAIAADGRVEVMRDHILYLSGTQIVNDGTIRLNQGNGANASIDVRAAVTLAGSGEILMDGDDWNDMIFAYYGHTFTQEAEHTIHGKGRILAPMVNRGTVRADSTTLPLRVDNGQFRNEGICEASGGAQLQIHTVPQNYANHTLSGGTWVVRQGSSLVLNGAPLDTVNAAVLLDGPDSRILRDYSQNSGLIGFAKIGPEGIFGIQNRDFTTTGNLTVMGRLNVPRGCAFTVPGACRAYWGRLAIDGTLTSPNPIALDYGSLHGSGTVVGDVVNGSGAILPGGSIDTLRIEGDLDQGQGGRIVVELGGTAPDRIDLLEVTGEAHLSGMLEVAAIDDHHVRPGDSYKVMTFGSREGEFEVLFGKCLEPGVCFDVVYNANDVTLVAYALDPSGVEEGEDGEDGEGAEEPTNLPQTLRLTTDVSAGRGGHLRLELPQAAHVELSIYDVAGRRVATLLDGETPAGSHSLRWDGDRDGGRGSGVYFARVAVQAEGGRATRTARVLFVH